MAAPITRLTKAEIVWLHKHRCKAHRHTYLAHYNCYLKEIGREEKIGFLDIEASNLKANFGIMLSYCIKPKGKRKILYGLITRKDLEAGDLDKRIVEQCIRDMLRFDRVVGYYSKRYDVPFIRTRALFWGLDFPEYREMYHSDVYDMAKKHLCLHSNRQAVVCETILGKTLKTRIDPGHWIKALQGDKVALAYILDHNKKDVKDLEKIYNKLVKFTSKANSSL